MRKGEVVVRLGEGEALTGRMTIGALEAVYDRTGVHPFKLAQDFRDLKDRPEHTNIILMCALAGAGLPMASAEAFMKTDEIEAVPYTHKRTLAIALLASGLFAPEPAEAEAGEDATEKKPIRLMIRTMVQRFSRGFTSKRT